MSEAAGISDRAGGERTTPSASAAQHRAAGPRVVRVAVVTISDTRTPANDTSGNYLRDQVLGGGHELVEQVIVKDDALEIRTLLMRLQHKSDVILTSGGTGISGRDVTIPVVESMLVKTIPGFGELFRMLSYQQVKGAAMLSRATGGLTRGGLLFALPGSLNAVQTAWEGILRDELSHLVFEVVRQGQPGQPSFGPDAQRPGMAGQLSGHVNQGAAAGIGRHSGVVGEAVQDIGLGRHATPGTVPGETLPGDSGR